MAPAGLQATTVRLLRPQARNRMGSSQPQVISRQHSFCSEGPPTAEIKCPWPMHGDWGKNDSAVRERTGITGSAEDGGQLQRRVAQQVADRCRQRIAIGSGRRDPPAARLGRGREAGSGDCAFEFL